MEDREDAENMENIIAVIISSIVTCIAFLGKKLFGIEKNIELYKESLEKVYLPLWNIFSNLGTKASIEAQIEYLQSKLPEIKNIVQNYRCYLSPYLDRELSQLERYLTSDGSADLKRITNLIQSDYENIKRNLGYPNMSPIEIFLNSDTERQTNYIWKCVCVIALCWVCLIIFFLCFYLMLTLDLTNLYSYIKMFISLILPFGLALLLLRLYK